MSARISALLVATLIMLTDLPEVAATGSRQLAIVVHMDTVELAQVDRVLQVEGMRRDPAAILDNGAGMTVLESTVPASSAGRLFEVASRLEILDGVLVAGELLLANTERRLVYSGFVLVEFRDKTSRSALQSWARRHGLTRERSDARERNILFRAPLDPSSLLDMIDDLPGSVGRATPIHHDIRPQSPLRDEDVEGYHILTLGRRVLAVVRRAGVPPGDFDNVVAAGEFLKAQRGVEFYEFDDEDAMMEAQRELRDRNLVTAAGPAVSIDPPRYLNNELIIGFTSGPAFHSATSLLKLHDLTEVRELPYLQNGHLFQRSEPSYALYDAAVALLAAGYADLAVPNVIAENLWQCATGDCTPAGHQQYLELIRAPGAWRFAETFGRRTTIGLLDEGFNAAPGEPLCDELEVAAMLNTNSVAAWFPSNSSNWCGLGANITPGPHGRAMALIAAAKSGATSVASVCDSLVGVAHDARLLDVELPTSSSGTTVASALWWMAGGVETGYAQALKGTLQNRRATVLNLSFVRSFGVSIDCPGASALCAPICTTTPCSLLDAVLERLGSSSEEIADLREEQGLRREGTLIVSAMRRVGAANDFASSEYTTAVGSVTTLGKPFDGAGRFHPAPQGVCNADTSITCTEDGPSGACAGLVPEDCDFGVLVPDVVAPMGGDSGTDLDGNGLTAGHSSAATAAVSGVAALMFDANPYLTAAQARCILRQTAQRPVNIWNPTTISGWPIADCEFDTLIPHSKCLGYGMVDACAAVRSASACRSCAFPSMSLADGIGTLLRPCRMLPLQPAETSYPCPCDEGGASIDVPFDIDHIRVCINCEAGDKVQAAIEKILDLHDCIGDENCLCRDHPACLALEVVNQSRSEFLDVTMEVCAGSQCWEIPGEWPSWPPGEKLSIPIPQGFEVPRAWRRAQMELHGYSQGEPIEFSRLTDTEPTP